MVCSVLSVMMMISLATSSAATATAAIARTKDLVNWERLPDLKTKSQQQMWFSIRSSLMASMLSIPVHRMVSPIQVLVVVSVGLFVDDITHAEIKEEIINARHYQTIQGGEERWRVLIPSRPLIRSWLYLLMVFVAVPAVSAMCSICT